MSVTYHINVAYADFIVQGLRAFEHKKAKNQTIEFFVFSLPFFLLYILNILFKYENNYEK